MRRPEREERRGRREQHFRLDHIGATLLGMWAEITVTLASVEGNAVSFDFTVRDAVEEASTSATSSASRKTAQRLRAKPAKAGG